MLGVFQSHDNRQKIRDMFTNKDVTIELFKPNYTDDESEDNDCTENDSNLEDGNSESEGLQN